MFLFITFTETKFTMKKDYNIQQFFPSAQYIVENAYMYAWECDIFVQMKSGYHYEIEKKVSRSDFRADFKKSAKHHQLANPKKEILVVPGSKIERRLPESIINNFGYDLSEFINENGGMKRGFSEKEDHYFVHIGNHIYIRKNKLPNRFFYLTPKGLLNKNEIPEYAGLLEYLNGEIKQVKSAKWLHKKKYNYDKILLEKYYWRFINAKNDVRMLKSELKRFDSIYDNPKDIYSQSELEF